MSKIYHAKSIHNVLDLTGNFPLHSIFTIESLDNQFRAFNLTKYAHLNLCKTSQRPLEFDRKIPSSPCHSNFPSSIVSHDKSLDPYIPPHQWSMKREIKNSSKPKENIESKDNPNYEDNSIFIHNEEFEAAWCECQKVKNFAVWNDPNEDLFLLSN